MGAFLVLVLWLSKLSAVLKTGFKSISSKFRQIEYWVLHRFYRNFKFHYLNLGVTFFLEIIKSLQPWMRFYFHKYEGFFFHLVGKMSACLYPLEGTAGVTVLG